MSMPEYRKPEESFVEMTEMVMPQHTNAGSTAFGGVIMSWIDIAGATAAMRHCRKQVVTASVDAINFLTPIKIGYVVSLRAAVNYVGRTSCEVGVRVEAQNLLSGEKAHAASAYLTFVAINSDGQPTRDIPALLCETPEDERRQAAAKIRRAARLSLKDQLKTHHEKT